MSSLKNEGSKPNRLINAKSPYLLQHAYNPVDWHPWGDEAFKKAVSEDKPVFLSIGYSTCHWCHVMEKESFMDEDVAVLLNNNYIAVKVDREERPDLDEIYMTACFALTGQGGWPLTVILTPDKKPFFAGTYFPRTSRYRMPGMLQILPQLADLWEKDRQKVYQAGEELLQAIKKSGELINESEEDLPVSDIMDDAFKNLLNIYDEENGGFGKSPKFPVFHTLSFLLDYGYEHNNNEALEMVYFTLKKISRGGIYDHLGYGFHRYATDSSWLIPHFEKMLYDQALAVLSYLEAFQISDHENFAQIASEVLNYVERDMLSPEGGFYTAEDADSDGDEGTFYVWDPPAVKEILGAEDGSLLSEFCGLTDKGNFENGKSILHQPYDVSEFINREKINKDYFAEKLIVWREKLFKERNKRQRPFRDEKIITAWNGLMIAAFSRGSVVLREKRFADIAAGAAEFIINNMIDNKGVLMRRYYEDESAVPAFLDDYAFFVWGLIELYEATFKVKFLNRAVSITEEMLHLFESEKGILNYSRLIEENIPEINNIRDGAMPSGFSVAVENLFKLGRMTGNTFFEEKAEIMIRKVGQYLEKAPNAYTKLLTVLNFLTEPSEEIVISGPQESPETHDLIKTAQKGFNPRRTILLNPPGVEGELIRKLCPFLERMVMQKEKPTAYLCRDHNCLAPVNDVAGLQRLLS